MNFISYFVKILIKNKINYICVITSKIENLSKLTLRKTDGGRNETYSKMFQISGNILS